MGFDKTCNFKRKLKIQKSANKLEALHTYRTVYADVVKRIGKKDAHVQAQKAASKVYKRHLSTPPLLALQKEVPVNNSLMCKQQKHYKVIMDAKNKTENKPPQSNRPFQLSNNQNNGTKVSRKLEMTAKDIAGKSALNVYKYMYKLMYKEMGKEIAHTQAKQFAEKTYKKSYRKAILSFSGSLPLKEMSSDKSNKSSCIVPSALLSKTPGKSRGLLSQTGNLNEETIQLDTLFVASELPKDILMTKIPEKEVKYMTTTTDSATNTASVDIKKLIPSSVDDTVNSSTQTRYFDSANLEINRTVNNVGEDIISGIVSSNVEDKSKCAYNNAYNIRNAEKAGKRAAMDTMSSLIKDILSKQPSKDDNDNNESREQTFRTPLNSNFNSTGANSDPAFYDMEKRKKQWAKQLNSYLGGMLNPNRMVKISNDMLDNFVNYFVDKYHQNKGTADCANSNSNGRGSLPLPVQNIQPLNYNRPLPNQMPPVNKPRANVSHITKLSQAKVPPYSNAHHNVMHTRVPLPKQAFFNTHNSHNSCNVETCELNNSRESESGEDNDLFLSLSDDYLLSIGDEQLHY